MRGMLSKVVTVGDKILLEHESHLQSNENEEKRYVSNVLELLDDETLKIGMPIEQSMVIPLEIDKRLHLLFYTHRGIYHCDCVILSRQKEERIYTMKIKAVSEIEKYQRREYYRISCFLSLTYEVYQENEDENEEELPVCQGKVTDLSGGGIRFYSEYQHPFETPLFIHFQLELNEGLFHFDVLGKVMSSQLVENRRNYYENRVEFTDLSTRERETIIKYVFQEERKQRRKEKGLI